MGLRLVGKDYEEISVECWPVVASISELSSGHPVTTRCTSLPGLFLELGQEGLVGKDGIGHSVEIDHQPPSVAVSGGRINLCNTSVVVFVLHQLQEHNCDVCGTDGGDVGGGGGGGGVGDVGGG